MYTDISHASIAFFPQQMLVTVSEQCDQKIMALRDEEKQEIVDLKKENQRLYKRIDDLRQEQVSLQTQVRTQYKCFTFLSMKTLILYKVLDTISLVSYVINRLFMLN